MMKEKKNEEAFYGPQISIFDSKPWGNWTWKNAKM